MDFFEEVDGLGVTEANLQRLMGMQEADQERVIETYKAVRAELRQRLATWSSSRLQDRFTAQRLRGTLLQVEQALQAWESHLMRIMRLGVEDASIFAVESLQDEIRVYDEHFTGAVTPINLDAVRIASERWNFLIEQYSVSFQKWNDNTRAEIERGLLEAITREDTHEQVIGRLMGAFVGYEWQLRRIVRTEMHNVYNFSKIRGMQEARGRWTPDLMKALFHPIDSRTGEDSILLAKLNPVIPINQAFTYTYIPGKSKKEYFRTFMAPPDRPNDRAVLIPYRPSWGASVAQQTPELTGLED